MRDAVVRKVHFDAESIDPAEVCAEARVAER